MAVDRIEMGELLARMQDLKVQAAGRGLELPADVPGAPGSFAEVLARSVSEVNAMQRDAERLAARFEMGDPQVDLVQVMVSAQKAGLAFQAVSEVRNHVVRAYQEVMSMAI